MNTKNTKSVCEWHSDVANEFDVNYTKKQSFIERLNIWHKLIDEHSAPHKKVLDIGCGSGVFSFYAAQRNESVIGVDAGSEMVNLCNARKRQDNIKNVRFVKEDIGQIDSGAIYAADLILCSSILEYMTDIEIAIKKIISLMNKNAILIISAPNEDSLYRKLQPLIFKLTGKPEYFRYLKYMGTPDSLNKILKFNGVTTINGYYYSKTPFISDIARNIKLNKYTDNLFVLVGKADN